MQPTMCSRCHKHVAVVFITKLEGGQSKNEGLCLKCAKELGIKPIDDMIQKMGITDEDLENLTSEMMSAEGGHHLIGQALQILVTDAHLLHHIFHGLDAHSFAHLRQRPSLLVVPPSIFWIKITATFLWHLEQSVGCICIQLLWRGE